MSKRPSGGDRNPKPTQRENNSQIIGMAAEQLADLLWRHWLYMEKLRKKNSKESDS